MKKIIMVLAMAAVLLTSGCTSSTQIFGGTGGGNVYGRIMAVEHYTEFFCDNWLVYFENDVGTGGEYGSQNKGSYCIKNNDKDIIERLEYFAGKGVRVKATYETAYMSLCGCDYSAWVYEVEELG